MRARGGGLRALLPGCIALGAVFCGCQGSSEPGHEGGPGGSTPSAATGGLSSGSGGAGSAGGTSTGGSSSGGSGTGGTAGAATAGTDGKLSGGGGSVAAGTTSGGAANGGRGGGGGAANGEPGGNSGTSNSGTGGTRSAGGSGSGTGGVPACPTSGFAWPHGAEAAVSLTYDDSLVSQLDNAMPALDQQGLKMTFFLVTNGLGSAALRARYTAALAAGHELGSHSVTHPCTTTSYTLDTMVSTELDPSIATLRSMGAPAPLTYAYPCGTNSVASNQSYVPEVTARFSAARGVSGVVANPKTVDLGNTPGIFLPETDTTGSTAIGYVTQARAQGGWAIFGFHGVGGDYSIYPKTGHDALAQYLGANKAKVWTATFRDVAAYVAKCR